MPSSIIQPSFASGELSPSLYSRVDIAKYSSGLRKCRNFIVHPHGGASNRPGTKYVATAKHGDKKCRVVKFVFNQQQAYILEFGHHYIRFFTDQQPIMANVPDAWDSTHNYAVNDYCTYSAATYLAIQDSISQNPATATTYWTNQNEYEIYSPYAEADLSKLHFEGSADVMYICHPDYQTRTLTRYGNAVWKLELYNSDDGPFMPDNITDIDLAVSAVTGTTTLTASDPLFDVKQVGALFKLKHYIEGQLASSAFSGVSNGAAIKCFTTWRIITHGTWSGTIKVQKSSDGLAGWTTLRTFTASGDVNQNTYGTEDIEINSVPFYVRVIMSAYSSGTCNADLTTDAFYQTGIVRATAFTSNTEMTVEVLTEVGLNSPTTEWAEGSWSDYRGWPNAARFFQDRLCFAGTYSEPMTTWMTQTSNYISFLRHSTLLDTDGISTNLPSRQVNVISGLVALRKLCVFTAASEWTIGPTSGNALTPKTVEQIIQGYRGSYGPEPVLVGSEAIFIQANSKVIRNLAYQLGSDAYVGSDLNILARHLFYKYNIVELAYQQDPDSIVWCLRDDGVLLGMTYMPEQEVVAWTWHDTGSVSGNPQGYIESICCIPGEGFDELWMSVKRGDYRFIERMSKRLVEAECTSGIRHQRLEDAYFMDCGITFGDKPLSITQIQLNTPILITAPNNGLTNGDTIKLKNIGEADASTLNGTTWIIGNVTTDTFELTTEVV